MYGDMVKADSKNKRCKKTPPKAACRGARGHKNHYRACRNKPTIFPEASRGWQTERQVELYVKGRHELVGTIRTGVTKK